ncbi:MAG: glycosyltransferase family 4 protein [Chitinophagaceae bacterium]
MKILQIIQRPQLRGAEIFACQLSIQLRHLGHSVDVLFLFGSKSESLPYALPYFHLEANEHRRWIDVTSYRKLANFIREGDYDIVQANAGDTLKYASLAKKLFGYHAKLIFRNANKISDFIKSTLQKQLNRWLMKSADGVASVSELCKKDFIQCYTWSNKLVFTLPIGIDTNPLQVYSSFEQAKISVPKDAKVLLHVASFVPEKNHQGLLRIYSKVLNRFPNTHLLLVGTGKLETTIKTTVETASYQSQVHFLGRRDDVLQLMQLADAFVLPSLIEGLPGVILEAMYCKTPVIAYNVGGISEIVNEATGDLIAKNDEAAFVDALVAVANHRPEDKIEAAYQLVTTQYNNKSIATQFATMYQQLVAQA